MFTGTADQTGGDKSGDRLIKEGDLFGEEFFAVAVKDVLGTPSRTATVVTRTAPSELLVIPSRECRRLQAFVSLRNSEKAMAIFEKFFINLPKEVSSEIATLATFCTIKMHATLAEAGDNVSAVFFVFRGGAVVTVETTAAAPTSDFGVTAVATRLGGGVLRAGSVGRKASVATSAAAPALTEPDRPVGRLSYTLVQLSTRAVLGPFSETKPLPSAASAAPGLFIRILGSFTREAEATMRVLNLYHSVLPTNLTWLPCQGTAGRSETSSSSFSDHLFLLRKGVPVGRISFNVAEASGRRDNATGIDDGNNNDVAQNTSTIGADTSSNNSKYGRSTGININPTVAGEDVGRGYDANIPAVFKAKGQNFAVVFALSPDRVETEWAKQQQRQQQEEEEEKEQGKQLLESEKRAQDSHRSGGTESAGVAAISGHGRASSSCSSHCSASQPDEHFPSTAGRDDAGGGEFTVGDAVEPAGLGDGLTTTGETPTLESDVPTSEIEVPAGHEAPVAVGDQGDTLSPAVGSCTGNSCDARHTSLGRRSIRPEDETDTGTPTVNQAGEGCDQPLADSVGGAKQEHIPGLFYDELLDKSDSESSGDGGDTSKWTRDRQQSTGLGAGSLLDGSAGDAAGGGGMDIEPEKKAHDRRSVLSWIISRMGLFEKVEGCYETEAKAFKKAVEILEGKETALAGTPMPSGSSRPEEETAQHERDIEGRREGPGRAGGNAMADLNEAPASRERHPGQERPPSPSMAKSIYENLACILPLYEWLSLGDGEIGAVETAIRNRSISDPAEAKRAGVDPFALWTEQRARRLRTNLFNLLTAAGPREIRSRCGVAAAGDGRRGVRSRRAGVHREGGGGGGKPVDDEFEEKGVFRSLDRSKAAKTAVRSARAAVLRQNQKLIQTEMKARQRLLTAPGTQAADASRLQAESTTSSSPEASISRQGRGVDGSRVTRSPEKPALADDSGSMDGKGAWFGTSGGSVGGGSVRGVSAKKGLRHELRVQMNIERKRARLFEDMQTLPYTDTKRGIAGAKRGNSGSGKEGRNTDGSGNVRPLDAGHQGSIGSNRNAPPAIVLRAPKVQAQKRLHGKPPSSFFARAYAAGVTLAPTEGPVLDEPCSSPAAAFLGSTTELAPPTTTEQQAISGSKAVIAECTSAAAVVVVTPHTTPPDLGNETAPSVASALSSVSIASNVSTCASPRDNSSIASDGQDTAGTSVQERSSRNNEECAILDCAPASGKRGKIVRSATLSRGILSRAGAKGVGRKAAKGREGSSTPRVPALHGELMLLDGCLHDRKVRTWVETTLVPGKKRAA
eukprot:g4091.t1